MRNQNRGVTLLALVITVIVLLILASIGINAIVGDNSIIEKTINAKDEERYSEIIEEKKVWETERRADSYSNKKVPSSSDIINKLHKDGKISDDEKETLLNGGTIYVAGKPISFGIDGEILELTTKTRDDENNLYAVISVFPIIAGLPSLQSYEEYVNIEQYFEGKTDEQIAQYFVEYEKEKYPDYYESNYPGEEITLELVLQDYGFSSIEELCEKRGCETIQEFIIAGKYIEGDEYNQYYAYYQLQYGKNITVTNPDGTTTNTSNADEDGAPFVVFQNGTYTFSADYNGQIKSISVEITSIKNEELELAKDGDDYLIYTIEDLVRFSINVNRGFDYEGKKVKVMNSLDFFQDNSYENPLDTSFGDYNKDGVTEGIKEEVIKESGEGFYPIGAYVLWVPETYQEVEYAFKGTFEGNNYSIDNIYINNKEIMNFGLFGSNYGVIQNLNISGKIIAKDPSNSSVSTYVMVSGAQFYVGGITGANFGTIDNCTNNINFDLDCQWLYLGGIAGYNNYATITNCDNITDVKIDENSEIRYAYLGGIVGYNSSYYSLIQNCFNYGSITAKKADMSSVVAIGGIFGYAPNSIRVLNCGNTADIAVDNFSTCYAGGIGGHEKPGLVLNIYNKGNLTLTNVKSCEVGGLIGYIKNGRCANGYNEGDINVEILSTSTQQPIIGGCIGSDSTARLRALFNSGNITVTGTNKCLLGGIVGYSYYSTCYDLYNIGEIEDVNNVITYLGGMFGRIYFSSGSEPTGGYLAGNATVASASGHTITLTSMELDADILLEILNAATTNEEYLTACDNYAFSTWKIDESISTEHPVFEWE